MFYFLFICLLLNLTFYNGIKGLNQNIVKELAKCLVIYKNVQTEVFAEKINGRFDSYIIKEDSIDDNLEISYSELKEWMGNEEAKRFYNEAENNFTKNKLFNLKKHIRMNTDNLLKFKVKKIFEMIQKNYIKLPGKEDMYRFQIRLKGQSFCLAKFLEEKFGKNNIIGYEASEIIDEETAIDNYFKIEFNGKNYVYRLKKINFSTTLYFEGTDEYNKLYECTKIIWVVTAYEVDKNGRKFIALNKLYKRFNPNQLYLNYIPIWSHGKEIKFDSNLIENKEVCSVCITKFASGNDVNITPCNHIFHIDCIETWLKNNTSCPLCRREILTPKLAEP